jgi:hypothetical protein
LVRDEDKGRVLLLFELVELGCNAVGRGHIQTDEGLIQDNDALSLGEQLGRSPKDGEWIGRQGKQVEQVVGAD